MSGEINKRLLLILAVAITGFTAGFLIENQLSSPKIPLPSEFIANPVIDKLYANAEGKVTAKTDDSLTLEKNGRQITMFIEEQSGLTVFNQENNHSALMTLDEVGIGVTLKGGVSVIVFPASAIGLSKPRKPGDIIAQRFSVSR